MKFLRFLLFPFSIIYGAILFCRNKAYDWNFFKAKKSPLACISVGNLSVGGTGKSPHIEYLIRLFKNDFQIATLSRGYGRNSSGFIEVKPTSTSSEVGDEPKQFKNKFPEIVVAVEKDRHLGIKKICELHPKTNLVLLDDAFQHRSIKPDVSILLTDFNHPFYSDYVLPSGSLREFRHGYKRANIIVVSKCPENISLEVKEKIFKKIKPASHQKIYFSSIKYGNFISLNKENKNNDLEDFSNKNQTVLLLTGIANSKPLENLLKQKFKEVIHLNYGDHHNYSVNELEDLKKMFASIPSENKIIITTEKDAMRLDDMDLKAAVKNLPIFYLPIEITFGKKDEENFRKDILNTLSSVIRN